jgi:hypothetical protein
MRRQVLSDARWDYLPTTDIVRFLVGHGNKLRPRRISWAAEAEAARAVEAESTVSLRRLGGVGNLDVFPTLIGIWTPELD